ncbi:diadenylate cyclase [Geofilum rubicundum]|nr:DNA integrity scanning protein DisA nucleotide-binding domain protein [Geofilum rubicundum]
MSFYIKPLVRACEDFSKSKTGALIVITRRSELLDYVQTGELINAVISKQLLKSVFFKNSPLHDGALIISQSKIKAAGCILPVSQNMELPKQLGLRHRAALGITEATDAMAIVVSEETGRISFFNAGKGLYNIKSEELEKRLEEGVVNN